MSDSDTDTDETKKAEPIRNSSSETSYDEEEDEAKADSLARDKKDGTLVETVQVEEDKMTSLTNLSPKPRRKRFIPKYEVDGVHRVILGEETQLFIDLVVGVHVSVQYPWKEVPKSKLLENIELAGEVSEFYPLKDLILKYPAEDILFGYLADESKDVEEFYICCTINSRDHCKQQSDKFIKRQEKKLLKSVSKKPRPWIHLGSQDEITSLLPINSRNLMELEVKAKFPTEYDPAKFIIRDSNSCRDGYMELTPYRQKFNNVYRRRYDTGCQVSPAMFEKEAQTVLKYPKNMWTQSIADAIGKEEGGGGDTVKEKGEEGSDEDDEADKEELIDEAGMATYNAAFQRLRKPSYVKMMNEFMVGRNEEVNSMVELNTVMDIYCNDYPNLILQKSTDSYTTMTFEEYVCFTDVRAKDKYVSCATFHPMWSGIVAISYADGSPKVMKNVVSRMDPIQRAVYGLNPVMIWSHIDSLIPKLYLEAPREVKTLSFCPFDENLLVGGCINGQIVVWDITNKLEKVENIEVLSENREKYRVAMNSHMGWMKPVQDNAVVSATVLSNLQTSHYGPVTEIKWLSPNFTITLTGKVLLLEDGKKSLQFLSSAEDGNILIWNLSVENVSALEGKKVKKSKRVLKRPSGLTLDVSPYKVLDRNLQPSYKLIVGSAGKTDTLCVQNFGMNAPVMRYIHTPRADGRGRKYFTCEIVPQSEEEINTIIYCGSQHGEVVRMTWEGHEFNTGEIVNSEYCDIKFKCCVHDGVIVATAKNPLMESLLLTVGGKIFAVWSDKLKKRPLTWKKRSCMLTDGAWSLYKPSLLFIATSEGDIETWDLLLKSDKPISTQTLSGTLLTHVALHTLPLPQNLIGISDSNGSFRMYLNPPIFQLESPTYIGRMEALILRELKVKINFLSWQEKYLQANPGILLEIRRKEGALLAAKEAERRRLKEEQEQREEEEAEKARLDKLKVIGPEERWQAIIQKLIERTIAVKKRINKAELIEQEKPLRELEIQRLEKERRMLEIMKNQKAIFNDTVAILFPEAVKKPPKVKKSLLSDNKEELKQSYLAEYDYLKQGALKTVNENPYKVHFSWYETILEGKERRQALNAKEDFIKLHKQRILNYNTPKETAPKPTYTSRRRSSSLHFAGEDEETEDYP